MLLLGFGGFSLLKAQEVVHFLDDFESGVLAHWTVIDGNNDGKTWRSYAFDEHNHVAMSVSRKVESTSEFLVSPLLDDVSNIIFRACSSYNSRDYFDVKVSTTDMTPSAFTTVFSDDVDDNWTSFDVALPADTRYVAIYHHFYGPDNDALYIDDVAIYGAANNHIYTVNIEGYTPPQWGTHPDFEVSVPANAHCSVSEVVWKKDTSNTIVSLTPDDTFNEEGVQYYMGVYLTPDPGYSFVDYTRVYFNDSPDPFDFVASHVMVDDRFRAWTIYYELKESPWDDTFVVDFETNDFSQYNFVNDPTYPWTVVNDSGNNYMISGNPGVSSSTSAITATHNFADEGYIVFDAECRGEGSSSFWDHCDFYIDEERVLYHGADVTGWQHYEFTVASGSHTFKWSYTKDGSVNPTGDYFAVDNIMFGLELPCTMPIALTVSTTPSTAHVSWGGSASSYTLAYKLASAATWNTVTGITENDYLITDLEPGNYQVRVQSDCLEGNWTSDTFTIQGGVQSTANWYGYAAYCPGGESWQASFIQFTMQDPATVHVASITPPSTHAATYANGYVWLITTDGDLCKAPLDNENKTFGRVVTIVEKFNDGPAQEMSYNPADGKIYYIDNGQSNDGYGTLKCFDPSNPTQPTTIERTLSFIAFAINKQGRAYGVEYLTGKLYEINLTDASTSLIGETGLSTSFVQSMAFDMESGELYWAQIYSISDHGLYRVNPETAETSFIGQIGGTGVELTGLFMATGDTKPAIEDVVISNFKKPVWGQHPDFNVSVHADDWYTLDGVQWQWNNEDEVGLLSEADVFNRIDCSYRMVLRLLPKEGHSFAENVTVRFEGEALTSEALIIGSFEPDELGVYTVSYNVIPSLVYDFDDNSLQGWTTIDNDGDGNNWSISTNGMGHQNSAYFVSSASYFDFAGLHPDNYLVSPTKGQYSSISFWACAQSTNYYGDRFGVAVSTGSNTDAADFTTIASWTTEEKSRVQGEWHQYTVDLSAYDGQDIWVALRHFDSYDIFAVAVDDIVLTTTYLHPNVSVIGNSATVTWEDCDTSYDLRYKLISAADWTDVTGLTSNSYTISNLTAGKYEVLVKKAGDDYWVRTSFTIASPVSNIALTGYTVPVWGEHPDFTLETADEMFYDIEHIRWFWREGDNIIPLKKDDIFDQGEGEYYMEVVLSPKSIYYFDGNTTVTINGDAAIVNATASGLEDTYFRVVTKGHSFAAVDETEANQIVAWPNPANNTLFLKNADDAMVTIYDNMGRLMLQQRYHDGLNISHLAKGIYAVQVNGQTFRIVH